MTKALSIDLRDRVARYVLAGHSRRQAAQVFGIAPSTAIRYVAQYEATGTLVPQKQGGDRRSKLGLHGAYVLRRVAETPDISLAELTAELEICGVSIHPSNLCRFLLAHGLTYKKNLAGRRTKAARRSAEAG